MTRTPDLAAIIRQAIDDRLADVHTMLPGRIDAYDSSAQKADVEPLIRRLQKTVDGELSEELPIIPGVPVVFPRAGGFKLTMPVQPGDRCVLIFCERSTEAYQVGQGRKGSSQLISQTDPDSFATHNLTDPVALLGWYNDAEALSSSDQDGVQLGEESGAIIHIGGDKVELYQKGASDAVALASKVNQRIGDLEQAVIQLVNSAYNVHTHLVVPGPLIPGPVANANPTLNQGTAPTPGADTASQKVTAV